MKLHIIGTGSTGNCYIIEDNDSALIIEAGVSFKKVKEALNFDTSKISGVLISHSHGDHSKYVRQYLEAGIYCYMHPETAKELNLSVEQTVFCRYLQIVPLTSKMIGKFKILPFILIHDVQCLGFQIDHKELGRTIFMTDTGSIIYNFENVNNWIIECNYSTEMLRRNALTGSTSIFLSNRIEADHLSLEDLIEFFDSQDLTDTNNIILVHGSDSNSDSEDFKHELTQCTGKRVIVAKNGIKIDFNKTM